MSKHFINLGLFLEHILFFLLWFHFVTCFCFLFHFLNHLFNGIFADFRYALVLEPTNKRAGQSVERLRKLFQQLYSSFDRTSGRLNLFLDPFKWLMIATGLNNLMKMDFLGSSLRAKTKTLCTEKKERNTIIFSFFLEV